MQRLLATLHAHIAIRTLTATTFCDECGEVCTPACRHDALREQTYRRARELNLYHH